MPPKKRKVKPFGTPSRNDAKRAAEKIRQEDFMAIMKLVEGLLDWYLMKVNGDPMTEGFDILMNVEGPEGTTGHKYSFGDTAVSLEHLHKDLEAQYAGCIRYAHANAGWWEKPDGTKFDGAIVTIESQQMLPTVFGVPIAADAKGKKSVSGETQVLSRADWSLLHRSPKK